jgi:hypothetical protein
MQHLGLTDYTVLPMAGVFKSQASDWAFDVKLPEILKNAAQGDYVAMQQSFDPNYQAKNIPANTGNWLAARYSKPLHDAAWWSAQTKGFDFSREDRVESARYNRILWTGLKGDNVPYPHERSGLNLSHNRKKLLRDYFNALKAESQNQPAVSSARSKQSP